jgi:CubicO group peptidase (beta-lactamase class C family)
MRSARRGEIPMETRSDGQGLPAAEPEEIGLSSLALSRIAPAMQAYTDSGEVAGLTMVIARHGRIGYTQALGYMDISNEIPMRTDGVFRIASLSKPVISAAALKLVDAGKLRLGDPVATYIPAFATVQVYTDGPSAEPMLRAPKQPMRIEHLLTHTSGLAGGYFNHPVDSLYRQANLRHHEQTLAEFADLIAELPLQSSPGDAWHYSYATDVLGRVIEVVSGQTLHRFLEGELLVPPALRPNAVERRRARRKSGSLAGERRHDAVEPSFTSADADRHAAL